MKNRLKQLPDYMKFEFGQLMLGVVIGLLGIVLYWTALAGFLEEEHGLHGLFTVRGQIAAPKDVVVVAIDQASATHLELSLTPSKWPRTIHADLIYKLVDAGARVIVFDLVFGQPSDDPENDIQLMEAMKAAGNVIVAERLVPGKTSKLMDSLPVHIVSEGSDKILPMFSQVVLGHAPFPLPRAARVNNYWTFKASAGDIPTMPVLALKAHARIIYPDFVNLLKQFEIEQAAVLPTETETVDLSELILTLRKLNDLVEHQPDIKQQLLQAVQQNADLTAPQKRQLHALIHLYMGEGARFLNLYGPPRTVKTIPYHRALKPEDAAWAARHFKDKTVFIGFSAESQPAQDKVRDDYHTVFSNADGLYVSGVELAATAFGNLLDDHDIKPASTMTSLLVLFLLGFTVSVIFLDVRLSVWFAIFLGLVPVLIYIVFVHYLFRAEAIWLPWIIPIVQTLCALLGALLLRYLAAKRERQQLEAAFDLFLPERVVDDIIKNAGLVTTSDSQLVYGVCLATDAEKYTTLGTTMDPRSLAQLMNDYYAVLFESVKMHQGIVSDVVGDAMLALWTAPTTNKDLRRQACLAALDMLAAINQFNQSSKHKSLPTRIGLHFGEMLLGHVGAIQHYEFRAVGDVVNTTNRIQGVNKELGTRLLVSTEVVAGLDEFLVRPLGGFLLVGRRASIDLVELIASKDNASPEQFELYEAFSSALLLYQSQKWQAAYDAFSIILEAYPEDGPAKFFLQRCKSLVGTVPNDSWDPTIEINTK